jgi:hypothetical protein
MRTHKRSICPGDIAVLKDGRQGRIRTVIGGSRRRIHRLVVVIDEEMVGVIPQQLHEVIPGYDPNGASAFGESIVQSGDDRKSLPDPPAEKARPEGRRQA